MQRADNVVFFQAKKLELFYCKLINSQVTDPVDAFHVLNRLDSRSDEDKRIVLDMGAERVRQLLKLQDGDSRRAHFHYLLAEPVR